MIHATTNAALLLLVGLLQAGEWVPMEVIATAYCPCKICCGVRGVGITADGTDTREVPYGVASDPSYLPYGSSVWIPPDSGYLEASRPTEEQRIFSVDDTGGQLRTETRTGGTVRVDLRYKHHGSARHFGRKALTIYVWRD